MRIFSGKMNYFNTMEEVNVFYNMIEHELHTNGSCIVYGSNSSNSNRYARVKTQICPFRYIRAYVHEVALLKKMNMFRMLEGLESSHLFHNKSCVNTEHLAYQIFSLGMKDITNAYRSKCIASKMKRTPLLYSCPIRVEWHHMNAPVIISL